MFGRNQKRPTDIMTVANDNCYPVACLWLRKQILANWRRRVGTRGAPVIPLILARVCSLRWGEHHPLCAIPSSALYPPLAHPFCDCARTFSTGNCQIECRAALPQPTAEDLVERPFLRRWRKKRPTATGQYAMERILRLSTKLAKCDTQRG